MTDSRHDPAAAPFSLAQALRLAATELAGQAPPPALQARVLAAARAARATPPTVRRGRGRWATAAACACVLGGTAPLVLMWMLQLPPPAPAPSAIAGAQGFLALVPADAWPKEATTAWLVNTELQGDRLAALGLPYDPARAGERLRAELLLHPSGEVLAVRLVP
jgi:hypothetical protein